MFVENSYNNIEIENLLYDIALESEAGDENKSPGRLRQMLANLCKRIMIRCQNNRANANAKGYSRRTQFWNDMAKFFERWYNKLANVKFNISADELNSANNVINQKVSQVKAGEQKPVTPQEKKESSNKANQTVNRTKPEDQDITRPDGDVENGSPTKSRKRAEVVREYAKKAREAKERGDMAAYKENIRLRDEAANNPDLNSILYFDPDFEIAIEDFLGEDAYSYTTLYGYNAIVLEGIFSSDGDNVNLYNKDAYEYEALASSLVI